LRFREEKAQFLDIDEFDIDGSLEIGEGSQSITLGSKMNHDTMRRHGGGFDQEADILNDPPFA
jgi:hypothetical protein